jgi:hypothetical protein
MSEINRLLAFDPDAFKQEARDRVFMHVGRALNEWNRVEELTSVLFHRLLLCGAYAISSAAFYSIVSFSTRTSIMRETANWYFRYSGFEAELNLILSHLDRLAGRRNSVAHAVCYDKTLGLLPSGYLSRREMDFKLMYQEIYRNRDFTLTIPDIAKLQLDCLYMQIWLLRFLERSYGWHTWLSKRPELHLHRVARYVHPANEPSQTPQIAGLLPPP